MTSRSKKPLAEIVGRKVYVNMENVSNGSLGNAVRLAEALDALESAGFKIDYNAGQFSNDPGYSGQLQRTRTSAKITRRMRPLPDDEIRTHILEGVREGTPSRRIYESLCRIDPSIHRFKFCAYFRHVRGGTYKRRGLLDD